MGNIINIFNKYFYNTTNVIELEDVKEPPIKFITPEYKHYAFESISDYIDRTSKHDKDFR